jgi:hypothetical protein
VHRPVWLHRVAAVAAALALPGAAQSIEPRLVPSEAAQCLQATDPAQPLPEYPFEAFKSKSKGRVLIEMRFERADSAPRVTVRESEGGREFVDAVRTWARTLRVPCLAAGARPAVLQRELVFEPDDRPVRAGPPEEANEARRNELLACLRQTARAKRPQYPQRMVDRQVQGRVYALLRFDSPDGPPSVELLHRPSARGFERSVDAWAQQYRLPCFEPGSDESFSTSVQFVFQLGQGAYYGFKAITLTDLLPAVTGIREQPLQLDTTAMGCPFDVRLTYLQPLRRNIVGVLDTYDAAQEPLLQWLRGIELNLPSATLDMVYADDALITIPCIKIKLTP